MIYITGDTHIPTSDIQKLGSKWFPEQKSLSASDYVIICGDFGGIWDGSAEEHYWIKWLSSKNFTTLFVDGNHENFDRLNQLDVVPFLGGKAHKIAEKVYHLTRGEVFEIDKKKIFTFGGASSHDKEFRTEGKNWWREELPSESEYKKANKILSRYGKRVDAIISHCAPTSVQKIIKPEYHADDLTEYFEELKKCISYDKWFFGHYHTDCDVDNKHIAVFNRIIKLG